MLRFRSEKAIAVELQDSKLIIRVLQLSYKHFTIIDLQEISLNNLEIVHGIIFNPSVLSKNIKNFLLKNKMGSCKAYVFIAAPINSSIPTHFTTLQAMLCVAKAGATIEHISHSSFKEAANNLLSQLYAHYNLLTVFNPPQSVAPKIGLALITSLFILGSALGYCYQRKIRRQISKIADLNIEITQSLQDLTSKQKELDTIASNNIITQKAISKFKSIQNLQPYPSKLLYTISKSIPKQTILTSLQIGLELSKSKNKPKPQKRSLLQKLPITLLGETKEAHEVTSFIKALSSNSFLQNVSLVSFNKIKREKNKKKHTPALCYTFHINAVFSDASITI